MKSALFSLIAFCLAALPARAPVAQPWLEGLEENVVTVTGLLEELGCFYHADTLLEISRRSGLSITYIAYANSEIRKRVGYDVIVPGAVPGQKHSLFAPLLGPGGVAYLRTEHCLSQGPDAGDLKVFDTFARLDCTLTEAEAETALASLGFREIPYLPEHMTIFEVHEHLGMLSRHGLIAVQDGTLFVKSEACA